MNKHEKLRLTLLSGASDANIDFDDLCRMLQYFGFEMRVRGSHHVFARAGVFEQVVLPRHGKAVKRTYVRDVRRLLQRYRIGEQP